MKWQYLVLVVMLMSLLGGCIAPQSAAPGNQAMISLVAAKALSAPQVPAALSVSAAEQLATAMFAEGVQIYQCKHSVDDATSFAWSFIAPEAVLYDSEQNKLGIHYAGPTWEANDGSKVIGGVKARADAPNGDSIPWLLLHAKSTEGAGRFGAVTSIQRVETAGGQAPSEACDPTHEGAQARIPYTAVYTFYTNR